MTDTNENGRTIYEFTKNQAEVVRVTESVFNGEVLYHLRVFVRSRDFNSNDEVWLPTKKGIAFRKDDLFELFKAMDKLKENIYGEH